jgi:hypothetical protein
MDGGCGIGCVCGIACGSGPSPFLPIAAFYISSLTCSITKRYGRGIEKEEMQL